MIKLIIVAFWIIFPGQKTETMTPLKTTRLYLRIDSREISYLKLIFEAYDGIATITTIDPQAGHIVLSIAPGCARDVHTLLDALKKEILIEPAPAADMP